MFYNNKLNSPSWAVNCEHENKSFCIFKSLGKDADLYQYEMPSCGICSEIDHNFVFNDGYNYENLFSSTLRSDPLTKDHKTKTHSLFSGCSYTFGTGHSDRQDLWSKILYDNISSGSGYFNIARPGNSISDIVFDIYKYVEEYGIPDKIFCLLPEYLREMKTYGARKLSKKEIKAIHFFQKREVFNQIKGLESFCKVNNIKLYVSSWHDETENFLISMGLESVIPLVIDEYGIDFWKTGLLSDGHWGKKQNIKFAEILLERL
jgi:hypothetical protein